VATITVTYRDELGNPIPWESVTVDTRLANISAVSGRQCERGDSHHLCLLALGHDDAHQCNKCKGYWEI
jgi:hypothetical protein